MKFKKVPVFLIYLFVYLCISAMYLLSIYIPFLAKMFFSLFSFFNKISIIICVISPVKIIIATIISCFILIIVFIKNQKKWLPFLLFFMAIVMLFSADAWIALNCIYGMEVIPFFIFFIIGWALLISMCDKSLSSKLVILSVSFAEFYFSLFYICKLSHFLGG